MELLAQIARHARRLAVRALKPRAARPHSSIVKVGEVNDLAPAASALSRLGNTGFQQTLRRLRDLYELATPALYLQVATSGEACRVVLVPWQRGQVAFSGRGFHLLAGADATSGIEAFPVTRPARAPTLYSTAPDHPVFAVALAQPGAREFRGYFPPYVTHVTIVADGREVVVGCPLAHDQGARVFRVDSRAA